MEIIGPRVIIKPLTLQDSFGLQQWGVHDNTLIEDYNADHMNDKDIVYWYRAKTIMLINRYFGVFDKKYKLIGYLGVKAINVFKRDAVLGLVFDPNYTSQGYGTETLETFLEYYFTKMRMKRMYLEVSEFNKRAMKLYEKMGFKSMGYYLDEFFNQGLDLNNPYYLEEKSSFVIKDGKIYNYIYKMKLDKNEFMSLRTRS